MSKTNKPSSEELSETIAKVQRELAALSAAQDQAEGATRDSAHDERAYATALETVNELRRDCDAKSQRLTRLRAAYEDRVDEELDAECERLRSEVAKAGQNYKATAPKLEERRKAVQVEYDRTMKEVAEGLDRLRREMQATERDWKESEARRRERFERRHPDKAEAAREQASQRQQRIEADMDIERRTERFWYEGFEAGKFGAPERVGAEAEFARKRLDELAKSNPVAADRLRGLKADAKVRLDRQQELERRGAVTAP